MGMIMYEREREQEKKNKEMYLIHKFYKVQTLSHKYLLSVTKKKKNIHSVMLSDITLLSAALRHCILYGKSYKYTQIGHLQRNIIIIIIIK